MEMCRYICIYRYRYYIIIGIYYGLIDAMFSKQGVSIAKEEMETFAEECTEEKKDVTIIQSSLCRIGTMWCW